MVFVLLATLNGVSAQDDQWQHKSGSEIRCADDTFQVGISVEKGGQTRMVDVTTQKTFYSEVNPIKERLTALEHSSECLNSKYSNSCKNWAKDTVNEMHQNGDYKEIVDALVEKLNRDPELIQALAEALKSKVGKK